MSEFMPNFDHRLDPPDLGAGHFPIARDDRHRFPCVDADRCDRCQAQQRRLDEAMETLMAEHGMAWCACCKAAGRRELATTTFRERPYCDACLVIAHQSSVA